MSGMNPQPTGKAREALEQGAQFTAWQGRGLAGFVPCNMLPKGKAASSSLPISNPHGLTASTTADAEPRAIAYPINLTEWEKQQRLLEKSEVCSSSCRNGLQDKIVNPEILALIYTLGRQAESDFIPASEVSPGCHNQP